MAVTTPYMTEVQPSAILMGRDPVVVTKAEESVVTQQNIALVRTAPTTEIWRSGDGKVRVVF